jgi:hypothetical protein
LDDYLVEVESWFNTNTANCITGFSQAELDMLVEFGLSQKLACNYQIKLSLSLVATQTAQENIAHL